MNILPPLFLAICHILITTWMIRLWRNCNAPGDLLIATLCGTLAYDNIVTMIARLAGADELLDSMLGLRWAMQSIFSPFMMIIIMEITAAAGCRSMRRRTVRTAIWTVVLVFSAHGLVVRLMGLDFGWTWLGFFSEGIGARIDMVLSELMILILGAIIWRRHAWPWIFISGLLMLLFVIYQPVIFGVHQSSGGAVILLLALAASTARFATPEFGGEPTAVHATHNLSSAAH